MNNHTYTFPEFTAESVLQVVSRMWDLSGRVPLPKFELNCPICSCDKILLKHWVYFIRKNAHSSNPHRCDVYMKCTDCSVVWQHGLVVPEEMHPGGRKVILWRDIKENGNTRE